MKRGETWTTTGGVYYLLELIAKSALGDPARTAELVVGNWRSSSTNRRRTAARSSA